jgi:hypothetical protein
MKALIDKEFCIIDDGGYKRGNDLNGRNCRVAFHDVANRFRNSEDNFKVITSGHVYILNYNEKTYKAKRPETFEEYRQDKIK